MKKILSILLVACMASALCVPAFADVTATECAAIGADLSESQVLDVYSQFGLTRGSVPEISVTNAEERAYLEGVVSESVIGTRSISCIYIKLLGANAGLTVTTNNINWCTEDMYKSALMTAGIYDAQVKVAAPFTVSGTAALTGVYKAYEYMTGTKLDEEAKAAAADELVVTAELADELTEAILKGEVSSDAINQAIENGDAQRVAEEISSADAVSIVNELKLILDQTEGMTDDELRTEIVSIASKYGYTLDDATIARLIELVRSMEGLSIADLTEKVKQFQQSVEKLRDTVETVQEYADQAVGFGQKVAAFFRSIADAFKSIFGG